MHSSGFSVYTYCWKWIENWMHGKMIISQVKNTSVWQCEFKNQRGVFCIKKLQSELYCWLSAKMYDYPHVNKHIIWPDNTFKITIHNYFEFDQVFYCGRDLWKINVFQPKKKQSKIKPKWIPVSKQLLNFLVILERTHFCFSKYSLKGTFWLITAC